ncbi:MAG: hypothetical protein ACTSRI_16335 [Promethearchaeota archaeon]
MNKSRTCEFGGERVVEKDPLSWKTKPSENYLDDHFLYRGVHKVLWKNWPDLNRIYPNFFITSQAEQGLSVDWSKYATPLFTLNHLPDPPLEINGIVELNVGNIKQLIINANLPINIQHNPMRTQNKDQRINRVHSLIIGINKTNKTKVKRFFSKIAKWAKDMAPFS